MAKYLFMNPRFPTDYNLILERIQSIDPLKYAKTRNYLNGAVTYLSPYISRGVISTKQVLDAVVNKGFRTKDIESFVKELCWRDYFQRVAQHKNVSQDIKSNQQLVRSFEIPSSVMQANTGIQAIDKAITDLYEMGYMHNHARMYTASIVCNLAQVHWLTPARWMYYHLLDGDWASNACSWQWVAGSNISKKYYANQENINRYAGTHQSATFLDSNYEALEIADIPENLTATAPIALKTEMPKQQTLQVENSLPTFIYNYYNLDPNWHSGEKGNRILLLEPAFFEAFPISPNCMNFFLSLSKNIPGLQIYMGSFQTLVEEFAVTKIHFKEHPLNIGYKGIEEKRDWIVPEINGYFPSFFAYWKRAEPLITAKYA